MGQREMKRPSDFIKRIQEKVAVSTVGPSALRGQGKGVLKTTREFLTNVKLERMPKSNQKLYRRWLDRQTDALLGILPVRGRPWGAARKALNLFMRDVLYNQYLSEHFKMNRIESWLEIPLDSVVAKALKKTAGRSGLPSWPGLKHLTPEISEVFQRFATNYASHKNIQRVHLDIYLWLDNR